MRSFSRETKPLHVPPSIMAISVRILTGDPYDTEKREEMFLPTTLQPSVLLRETVWRTDKNIRSEEHTKKWRWYYCYPENSRNHLALNSSHKLTFLNSGRYATSCWQDRNLEVSAKAIETPVSSVASLLLHIYTYPMMYKECPISIAYAILALSIVNIIIGINQTCEKR